MRLASTGDARAAAAALVASEAGLCTAEPAIAALRWSVRVVGRQLARIDVESLLSVVMLHLDTYDRHRARQDLAHALLAREAVALYPQLAHVLDRLERPAAATQLLQRLPGPGEQAARHLYNRRSTAELEELRRSLRQAATVRLARLARAVTEVFTE